MYESKKKTWFEEHIASFSRIYTRSLTLDMYFNTHEREPNTPPENRIPLPLPPQIQMEGTLGSRFSVNSSGEFHEDGESQPIATVPSIVNDASRSWKQARNNPREGSSRGNGGGFGGYGVTEAEVDEGEPLLCEEVEYARVRYCSGQEPLHSNN